ncbi:hypothetical protein FACS189413_04470 [Bacteroidia bacterium]|nr:hypothetical protein FACS189413_04470 [Bacteroidia bacterium]
MKQKFSIILYLFLMLYSGGLYAQNTKHETRKIKGTVVDSAGEPLPGVSISLQGTNSGTVTDLDGDFNLSVMNEKSKLVFSYLGYKKVEEIVGDRLILHIVMTEDTETLNEVVVVGYGTQKKVSVVAAITTIEPGKLKTGTTRSLSNNLAGNLSGVIGVQRSGEPGYDNSDFWIRGISTFSGGNNPMVLIDGIERSLNDIDIQEIESFSILKDASASAVYGVRGANGVILITTKRGKVGKPVVNVKVEHAITQPTQLPKFLNSADYLNLLNEVRMQDERVYYKDPAEIEKYRSGADPELYPNVNWIEAISKPAADNTRATLDVNGGYEKLRYAFVAAYYHENGILRNDPSLEWDSSMKITRFNMRSNVDVDVSPTTLLRFNIGGFLQNYNRPPQNIDAVFSDAFATPPFVHPTSYSNGTIPKMPERANPWATVTQTGFERWTHAKIESVFTLEQDLKFILNGLKLKGIFSFDNYSESAIKLTTDPTYYSIPSGRNPETGELVGQKIVQTGSSSLTHETAAEYGNNNTYLEGSLTYDQTFGKHTVNMLFLYNQKNYDDGSYIPFRNQGIAGRASYIFDGKYIGEFNFGYNGSENFAPGKRFGFFPSVALGWIATEEPFMQSLTSTISKLKLRASYGLAGRDNIGRDNTGRRFAYLSTINKVDGYAWGLSDGRLYRDGYREGDIGIPNLTWETVAKANAGIEIEFLKSLELQVDVFYEKCRDIFMQRRNYPAAAGLVQMPWSNFGKVNNKGAEVGHPVNQLFGLEADGLFTEADFADLTTGELKAGIPMDGRKAESKRILAACALWF